MKKITPQSKTAAIGRVLIANSTRLLLLFFWILSLASVHYAVRSKYAQPVEPTFLYCTVKQDLPILSTLVNESVTTTSLKAGSAPAGAIQDCNSLITQQLQINKPLSKHSILTLNDLILSDSTLADILITQTDNREIVYLSVTDVHSYAPTIAKGHSINLYAHYEDNPEAELLISTALVVDIVTSLDDEENELTTQFALALAPSEILTLTHALSNEAFIQLAVLHE